MPTPPFQYKAPRIRLPIHWYLTLFPATLSVIIIVWLLKASIIAHHPAQLFPVCNKEINLTPVTSGTEKGTPHQGGPLTYIRQSTVHMWNARDFLVVFGIPSLDTEKRRWRRHMLRVTWGQLPGVANSYTNFAGSMLTLFIVGRHPAHNFTLSEELSEEGEQWQDIIIHPMNEELMSRNEPEYEGDSWEVEEEIGLSRKTIFWFQFALHLFPRVPFLAKGNDDIFLSAPQYLADLRRLPKQGIYWGALETEINPTQEVGGTSGSTGYIIGHCFTLARDVAEQLVSYGPLGRILWTPYKKEMEPEYLELNMHRHDAMVGRILNLTHYPYITVAEGEGRFHGHPRRESSLPDDFVVVRRPTEHQYYFLASHSVFRGTPTTPTVVRSVSERLMLVEPYP